MIQPESLSDHFNQDAIVLDIGGTFIRIGHIEGRGVSAEFEKMSSDLLRVDDAYGALVDIVRRYRDTHQLLVEAVVIGIPGMLNKQADEISHCNNIPQLQGTGLREMLVSSLQCQVILEQDIMLQVLGEWRSGAAMASPSVFGVYFGTGIGAAFINNGVPQLQSEAGLQAGHIPIMAQGKRCLCGNTDCIEAYASGHTLIELAQNHDCKVEELFLKDTDVALQGKLDDFVRYQSYLLATLITLFVPHTLLIGGGITKMSGYPKSKLLEYVYAHVQKPYPAQSVKIAWASLETSAVLHGAMVLIAARHSDSENSQ